MTKSVKKQIEEQFEHVQTFLEKIDDLIKDEVRYQFKSRQRRGERGVREILVDTLETVFQTYNSWWDGPSWNSKRFNDVLESLEHELDPD